MGEADCRKRKIHTTLFWTYANYLLKMNIIYDLVYWAKLTFIKRYLGKCIFWNVLVRLSVVFAYLPQTGDSRWLKIFNFGNLGLWLKNFLRFLRSFQYLGPESTIKWYLHGLKCDYWNTKHMWNSFLCNCQYLSIFSCL